MVPHVSLISCFSKKTACGLNVSYAPCACAVESCQSTLDDARTLSLSAHAQILLAGSGGAHGGSTLFLLSFIIITIIIIVATAIRPLPVLISMAS